jgi:hypothetical protein
MDGQIIASIFVYLQGAGAGRPHPQTQTPTVMNKKTLSALLFVLLQCLQLPAQITLTAQGKPKARIVFDARNAADASAAQLLNKFIGRISGTRLPTVGSVKDARRGDVVISGRTERAGEDGFHIRCSDGRMTISSGGDKGSLLGVVHLLERYLGCDYFARNVWQAPRRQTVVLPAIDWAETPAFRYRQTQSYGTEDADYRAWYGLEEPDQMFAGNLWVHTFNQLLPASQYGRRHPEWYSMINGKRQPGDHSQWCLTNTEVFEAACNKIDSIFRAHPGMKMISVSQNDGNNTNCQCPSCRRLEEAEGSPSGPIIHFMNKLARRFPDKEFSTLAYLFSMQPPRHVRPLPNVNIMLCSIDCRREVPLTDNASGREFMKAIDGWAKISRNIFVWDYGINFDNMVAPFPNLHVLRPNMRIFRSHNANMLFEQVNGTRGTDFAELRGYLIGKLMWNPDMNADSLTHTFLRGYYGAAAPAIYQYLKVREGALLAGEAPLWIYDSPISHKQGMLNDRCMKRYQELFDEAEAAVKADSVLLSRVQLSRLPIMYAELEIARTRRGGDTDGIRRKVATFRELCIRFGVKSLNERNNSPADYCDLYLKRFLPQAEPSKAIGAKVTYQQPPAERYRNIADRALTDGLYGGASYVESWVGWEGKDADFTIDLGREMPVSAVSVDCLHQLGAWVLLPRSVTYQVSADGRRYVPFGQPYVFSEDRDLTIKYKQATVSVPQAVNVRYIKVHVATIGQCPAWHYGVGHPAWFFIDEVEVKTS